jgi:heat shock protein HslJ
VLDWQGAYNGILPCADCEGVITTLTLNSDNSYVILKRYLGKGKEINKLRGSFTWDKSGNQITLAGVDATTTPSRFKLGENRITQLDLNGNPITGPLAGQYVLTKSSSDIVNRYWKLVTVNGKRVVVNESQIKEPHVRFSPDKLSVTGNGGCNNFRGTYKLTDNNGITFSPLMATKMACIEMDVEDRLLKALSETGSYTVENDSLKLFNREKSKLATFGAVWLQ